MPFIIGFSLKEFHKNSYVFVHVERKFRCTWAIFLLHVDLAYIYDESYQRSWSKHELQPVTNRCMPENDTSLKKKSFFRIKKRK